MAINCLNDVRKSVSVFQKASYEVLEHKIFTLTRFYNG